MADAIQENRTLRKYIREPKGFDAKYGVFAGPVYKDRLVPDGYEREFRTLTERDVARVVGILERRGARAFAEQVAGDYSARAMRSLTEAGQDSPARQAARELALSLLRRTS